MDEKAPRVVGLWPPADLPLALVELVAFLVHVDQVENDAVFFVLIEAFDVDFYSREHSPPGFGDDHFCPDAGKGFPQRVLVQFHLDFGIGIPGFRNQVGRLVTTLVDKVCRDT